MPLASKKTQRDQDGTPIGVEVTFDNGTTVRIPFNGLTPAILAEATAHGLNQKLGDSYSGAKGDVAWAQAQCEGTMEALLAGDWNRRGGTGDVDLLQALRMVFPSRDPEEVREVFDKMDADTRKDAAKTPSVKAALASIKADRLAAKAEGAEPIDLDELFN